MPEATPVPITVTPEAISAFCSLVETGDPFGCWRWVGFVSDTGYGRLWSGDRSVSAHRFSYTFAYGLIPEGLHIDHLCRRRACVRPDHLEAVTPWENSRRVWAPKWPHSNPIWGLAATPPVAVVEPWIGRGELIPSGLSETGRARGRRAWRVMLAERLGLAMPATAPAVKGPPVKGPPAKRGRPLTLPSEVREEIRGLRAMGRSYPQIASHLNEAGVATAQGGRQWWPSTVRLAELVNDS